MASIADILLAQGRQAADTRLRLGEISGQMWSNLGQTIAQVPGQVMQAQAQQRRADVEKLQLEEMQARKAGQSALDQAMRPMTPQGPQEPGMPMPGPQQSYLDENGLWDIPKLNNVLAASGSAHLAPEILKSAENLNESITKQQQYEQQAANGRTVMFGHMADALKKLTAAGVPLDQGIDLIGQQAVTTKRLKPQEIAAFKGQLLKLPPEQVDAALTSAMDAAAKLSPTKTHAKDSTETDIFGRQIASNIVAPTPTRASIAMAAAGGDPTKANELLTPPPAPPASQGIWARVKGLGDVQIERIPGRTAQDPGKYLLPQADGTMRELIPGKDFVQIPAAPIQIMNAGQTAVANIPDWARTPDRPLGPEGNIYEPKIGTTPNGLYQDALTWLQQDKYPPLGLGQNPLAVARRAAIDAKVGAIAADAGMDKPEFAAFYRANAGSLRQQQQAFDTASVAIAKADKDVDLLEKILPKVGDVGSPLFNKPLRSFTKDVAGNADLSEFATRLRSVQTEYGRILNASPTGAGGTVLSDSARHEVDALLEGQSTVAQMLRSIAALKSEGGNRLLSQGEQIRRIADRMRVNPPPGAQGTPPPTVNPKDPMGLR